MVLASLGVAVATLILVILSTRWRRLAIGALAAGVIGAVLLSAAPVYLYLVLPGTIRSGVNSFFGSYAQDANTTWTWGGGPGWFTAYLGSGAFLVSGIFAFVAARRGVPR